MSRKRKALIAFLSWLAFCEVGVERSVAQFPPSILGSSYGSTREKAQLPVQRQMPSVFHTASTGQARLIDGKWRFQFQDAPWSTVLKQFARTSGLSLHIQSLPTSNFTYFDERQYGTSQAIDVFNDYLLPQGFLLVRNGSKLTAIASNGTITDGVVPFVPVAQLSSLGRHELASVAIPVKSNNPQSLVSEVEELMSNVGRARALTTSKRLLLTDTGAYLRPIYDLLSGSGIAASEVDTVVYKLRNTQAAAIAQAVNDRFKTDGSGGQETGGVAQASFAVPEAETNSLLLKGNPAELAQLQRLISELDQSSAEVLIQALIVEVQLGNTDEQGVELGIQDSVLFNRSVVDNIVSISETITAANGVQTTNDRIISQTAAPGFNFNSPLLGNNTSVSPDRLGGQSLSSLGVGRTNGDLGFGGLVLSAGSDSINILIRALQAYYKVDILSRPQVRTVDNKEAFIQAGQQVPVVDGVSVTANGNANPVIRQDRAGIILKVTPKASHDGTVQLTVSAEKSAFQLTPGSGVPIFTDATNGNVIEAPVKDITTAETTVRARSGQTIVLGGLITRDESVVERKVPILGDIPLIKRLFRYDFADSQRKELLIFLTPHVINDENQSNSINLNETAKIHACIPEIEQFYGNPLLTDNSLYDEEMLESGETIVAPLEQLHVTPLDSDPAPLSTSPSTVSPSPTQISPTQVSPTQVISPATIPPSIVTPVPESPTLELPPPIRRWRPTPFGTQKPVLTPPSIVTPVPADVVPTPKPRADSTPIRLPVPSKTTSPKF